MIHLSRRGLFTSVGALALTSLATGPAANAGEATLHDLTEKDWAALGARARAASDREGEAAANAQAERIRRRESGEPGVLWTSIAKKAVIVALKYGRKGVPSKFRPFTDKIVHVLETTDVWEQTILSSALISAGIPADLAYEIARWVSAAI